MESHRSGPCGRIDRDCDAGVLPRRCRRLHRDLLMAPDRSRAQGRRSSAGGRGRESAPRRDTATAEPASLAREICLRLLTMAPRTRAQLADALARRGVPDEVADEVLGRFTEIGLI